MKNQVKTFLTIAAGVFLSSCTNEEAIVSGSLREINATLKAFRTESTRTDYNVSEDYGFETVWSAGDVLGIYPIGGDQVSFPISEGVGTTSAKFDGGSWALRGNYKYAAYYPFSVNCYTIDQKAIPVSFLGQVQNGDNSTAHLSAVDFMAAAGTEPSADGSVNLQFEHIGCFLRMQLTMPEPGTFTKLEIESDGNAFSTQGTVDLSASIPAINATASTKKLTLNLSNIETTEADQQITLYMMVAPDDLSDSNLTFTVSGNKSKVFTQSVAGKNMLATYAYDYSLKMETLLEAPNTHNGHEYVDLGLPSGLKWASCNIGAEKSEDYGDYLAWGETQPKRDYSESKYEYCVWVPAEFDEDGFQIRNGYYEYIDLGDDISGTDYDAAHVRWGGSWRMPTKSEFQELKDNCTWTWIVKGSTNGYKITGSNNNWIFLPACGGRQGSNSYYNTNHGGEYWTSTLVPSEESKAYFVEFFTWSIYLDKRNRFEGIRIRPVTE